MIFNKPHQSDTIRLIPLGGVGDVTKNMYVYEYRRDGKNISDIIIVDCGIGFPYEAMYGVDLVLPEIKVPVYGTRLTAALAEVKLRDFGMHRSVNSVNFDDILRIGPFTIEF